MAADWYCEIDGEQYGPVSSAELKHLAKAGKLQPAHPVWKEGMQVTVQARTVKGLFDAAPVAAPAAAPPAASNGGADATARQLASALEPDKSEDLPEFELIAPEPKKEEHLIEFEMVGPSADEPEEFVEVEEAPKPKKKAKEKEEEAAPDILAEVAIVYREGVPDLDGPLEGMLTVESTGLRFQFEEEDEFRIAFDKLENLLEPIKGDYPPSTKKKALGKKLGGKAGKLAAGLMGKWLGGDAGKLVEKVGGAAGDIADKSGDLGKPPRNRLTAFARIKKARCKILFDVSGADRDEMNEEARVTYKQIQKARNKATTGATDGETNISVVINQAGGEGKAAPERRSGAALAAAPTAGRPFRVMTGGQVRGPYSLEELQGLLSAGKLGGDALIGVETWLPAATLGALLGSAPAARGGGAVGGSEQDEFEEVEEETNEEFGDFEEVEEEEPEEEPAPAHHDSEGALPVDEEFKI